jgi:hypothetical protein
MRLASQETSSFTPGRRASGVLGSALVADSRVSAATCRRGLALDAGGSPEHSASGPPALLGILARPTARRQGCTCDASSWPPWLRSCFYSLAATAMRRRSQSPSRTTRHALADAGVEITGTGISGTTARRESSGSAVLKRRRLPNRWVAWAATTGTHRKSS